jgi:hypothetical protein
MTITQLQYVLAVAEHRNFTLAAEKCFVTQPTLSMQIQKIEEELGIRFSIDQKTHPTHRDRSENCLPSQKHRQ